MRWPLEGLVVNPWRPSTCDPLQRLLHEVRQMIATLREIFMSKLCSIKSLVYVSIIARAFHCEILWVLSIVK